MLILNNESNLHATFSRRLNHLKALLFVSAIAFGITSTTSYAGVIAVNSSLDLVATTGLNTFEVIDVASASQGASTNNLGPMSANAVSTSVGGTSITSGTTSATWSNAAAGVVRFDDIGWDNSNYTNQIVSFSSLAGTQWTYTFIADIDGLFTLDWNVLLLQPIGDSFGLNDFRFTIDSGGGQTVMNVNTTGSTTRNIFAGTQYMVEIHTNSGIVGGVGQRTSFMDGVFNWSMDSGPMNVVPEPAAIALMGLGIFGLFASRRK